MKRILHLGTSLISEGGIENYLINLYKEIDKRKFQFDFLVIDNNENEDKFENVIKNLGGIIYRVDKIKLNNFFNSLRQRMNVFKSNNYDIVHIHTNSGIRLIEGILARICGAKNIIFHSHANKGKPDVKYRILQPFFRIVSTKLLACAPEAGIYMFGSKAINSKKFSIAKNAVDSKRFEFDELSRKDLKNELNILDKKVIGFIGRLAPEKNIGFIINIFEEINKLQKDTILLIVGDGIEYDKLQKKINESQSQESILMLGSRTDTERLLSVMDVLLLPSKFEALPVVLVEAQASGLYCYTSDVVSRESQITGDVKYISLMKSEYEWAREIVTNGFDYDRKNKRDLLVIRGYDIQVAADKMQKLYEELTKEGNK